MLIRHFRNNDTGVFRKYWRGTVCTFAPVLGSAHEPQALKIRIDYSVNISWSSEHIFNFLRFVIQKSRVFLKNEVNELNIRIEKSKYTRSFFTLRGRP